MNFSRKNVIVMYNLGLKRNTLLVGVNQFCTTIQLKSTILPHHPTRVTTF